MTRDDLLVETHGMVASGVGILMAMADRASIPREEWEPYSKKILEALGELRQRREN